MTVHLRRKENRSNRKANRRCERCSVARTVQNSGQARAQNDAVVGVREKARKRTATTALQCPPPSASADSLPSMICSGCETKAAQVEGKRQGALLIWSVLTPLVPKSACRAAHRCPFPPVEVIEEHPLVLRPHDD